MSKSRTSTTGPKLSSCDSSPFFASFEALEQRLLLDGALGDSGFATDIDRKATIIDENDNAVTIIVSNAEATVYTSQEGGGEILGIDVTALNDKAVLKINSRQETEIDDIQVSGSLRLLNAGRVNIANSLSVEGWATKIVLGDIASGATVDILTDSLTEVPDRASLIFLADEMSDCDMSTGALPVKLFRATSYIGGSLTGEYFSKIQTSGDFSADVSALDVDTRGYSLTTFIADEVNSSSFDLPGGINQFKANDLSSSDISAGWMNVLAVGNNRSQADFDSSITLDGDHLPDRKPVLNSVNITGDVHDASWSIAGEVKKIQVRGDTENLVITGLTDLDMFSATNVTDTDITVTGDSGKILVDNWAGGDITAESVNLVKIRENLTDADWSFSKDVEPRSRTINNLTVGEQIANSTIRSAGDVGTFRTAQMTDSALLVGVDQAYSVDANSDSVLDLPGDAVYFNDPVDGAYATINSLQVIGARGITADLMDNSTIAAGAINAATIKGLKLDNGDFYGIMYKDSVNRLTLNHNSRNYRFGADNWPDTDWFVVADVDVNHPPKVTADSFEALEDTPTISGNVLANDADLNGDNFDLDSFTQPAHGTVSYSGSGVFNYTPEADYNGTDSFTYTIADEHGDTTTGTVTITIAAVNDAPTAVDDSYTTDEDQGITITDVLANDSDIEGDEFTIVSFTQAAHGSVARSGNSFTYTPDSDYYGTDSFTYSVQDSNGATSTATVSITVNSLNDAPTAVDDSYTTDEDTSFTTGNVLSNDSDNEGDSFTITGYTNPAHGTLSDNGDGTFDYAPEANFNGTDSFTYTITDTTGSSTATVTITVSSVNDAPVAADDSDTTNINQPRTTDNVLANDSDTDGDTLSVFGYTQPANGSVSYNDDGTFTYTPDTDFTGTDSFTYTVSDGNGGTDTATVSFTVNDVANNIPQAVNDSYTSYYNNAFTTENVLTNDSDADGHTLTITSYTQPTHATVVYNDDGTFTYTLSEYFAGNDTFTYTVSDGYGGTDTATVTITKPEITIDVLGAPSFDGSDVEGLTVYRIRATAASGDNFDLFQLDSISGAHQLWSSAVAKSLYSEGTGLTEAQNALDTHLLFPSSWMDLSMTTNETNLATNPTGGDYSDGGVTPTVGLGTFEVQGASLLEQFTAQSFQFAQLVLPNDSDFTISGSVYKTINTTYSTPYSFDVEATEDPGPNNAPVAVDESYTTYYNSAFTTDNVLANDSDSDSDPIAITSYTQGTYGSVADNGDGTFTYTLNADTYYTGDDTFTYTISDGNGGSDTATVTISRPKITVDNLGAPTLDGSEVEGLTVYRIRATALLGEDKFDTFTVDTLSGICQLWADGSTKTPYSDSGGFDADYSDLDSHFLFTSAEVFLSLGNSETNDASNPQSLSVGTNVAGIGTLQSDGEALMIQGELSYQFLQIVVPNTLNLTISGQAAQGASTMDYSVEIVASEDAGDNSAPSASDDSYTSYFNTAFTTGDVLANDTDADSHTLTITSYTQPTHGTIVYNDDGTFTYTLSDYFAGDDTFTYTVSDGHGASDTSTVTITKPEVTIDVLGAPTFDGSEVSGYTVYRLRATKLSGDNFDLFSLDEISNTLQLWSSVVNNSVYSAGEGLTTNQNALDTHLLFSADMLDLSLSVLESNDGSTPGGADYSDGGVTPRTGLGTFEIQGSGLYDYLTSETIQFAQIVLPNTETVTLAGRASKTFNTTYNHFYSIEIEATESSTPNTAPVAADEGFTAIMNSAYTTANVLTNDSDADDDTLSISGFTQPAHGTVVYNDDGTFTYTLSEYFVGDDSFTYTLSDGRGGTDTATVTITKPKITIDELGSPSLDGTEIPGLSIYRLRCTADSGEDNFDVFQIYEIANTHQVWGLGDAQTTRLDAGLLDTDWLDFDTHFMLSSSVTGLSLNISETNDGSNPSGQTFNNGTLSGTAGIGTFEIGAIGIDTLAIPGASYQFLQIVVRNTDTVTVAGEAVQTGADDSISTSFSFTLD